MKALLGRPALRVGDEVYDIADLVIVGLHTGAWQALISSTQRGCGLERSDVGPIPRSDVRAALTDFRRQHGLLAAADVRHWLDERGLDLDDLEGVLRRRLLRERFGDLPAAVVAASTVADALAAEAICGGTLQRCADTLRAWVAASGGNLREATAAPQAVATESVLDPRAVERLLWDAVAETLSGVPALGSVELHRRARRVVGLHVGYQRVRDTAVSSSAIVQRLADRRVDWTVVIGAEVTFASESAAREAMLHLRDDQAPLHQLTHMLHIQAMRRVMELATAPAAVVGPLLSALPGEPVGPWEEDGRWHVLVVDRRVEPDISSTVVRDRAHEELLSEMVERAAAGRVVQHAAL
ncbi:MAG TPA: hypothetical protein VMM13_20315 [Euzebya sp.]|nr:hypothetical protein [Euzebya sp.]